MARKSGEDSMVFGESLLERDFIRFCNLQPDIVSVEYQPLTISYNHNKRARKYTPDFLITDVKGQKTMVEIKPLNRVNDAENAIKFEVAQMFCQERAWKFKVITEKDLRQGQLSNNINILLDVMRFDLGTHDLLQVYDLLVKAGPCSIEELQKFDSEIDRSMFTAIVYRLLLDRYFIADLVSHRLSNQTILTINKGKEW